MGQRSITAWTPYSRCRRMRGVASSNCRRDLLDHVIILNERPLERLMTEYIRHYDDDGLILVWEQILAGRIAAMNTTTSAKIISIRRLGGPHQHIYNTAVLLLSIHILKAGELLHVVEQNRSPVRKVLKVVRLNGVLVLRICIAAADTQVLDRLKETITDIGFTGPFDLYESLIQKSDRS